MMKRFVICILAVVAAGASGTAAGAESVTAAGGYYVREYRNEDYPLSFEARLGIGGAPTVQSEFFSSGSRNYIGLWFQADPLARMYKDYSGPLYTTGAVSGEFVMNFGPRASFTTLGGICCLWHDNFNGRTEEITGRDNGVMLYLAPGLRFYWVKKDIIRLYSGFYLGVSKYFGFDELKYSYRSENGIRFVDESFKFLGQVTPIGLEVGRKLYGFLEFGGGTVYCGASIGIGYKF